MTDWKISEQTANKFYARDLAKRDALKAAGGLASDKTLRDEFAGLAMAAIMQLETDVSYTLDAVAGGSYRMADAMLEARNTPTEDET